MKVINTDDCLLWARTQDPRGYGHLTHKINGKKVTIQAHRMIYEALVDEIPEGYQIDHLCKNPPCINVEHLEPVTQTVNIQRGDSPTAINRRKTSCNRGHPFDEENTYWYGKGRYCKTCQKLYRKSYNK